MTLLVFLATPLAALAQGTRGTILGTVRDQTQAVVPGATVTAREVGTGLVSHPMSPFPQDQRGGVLSGPVVGNRLFGLVNPLGGANMPRFGTIDLAGPVPDPSPTLRFDPAAFAFLAAGTFGDAGRNSLRGDGFEYVDLSLVRKVVF